MRVYLGNAVRVAVPDGFVITRRQTSSGPREGLLACVCLLYTSCDVIDYLCLSTLLSYINSQRKSIEKLKHLQIVHICHLPCGKFAHRRA